MHYSLLQRVVNLSVEINFAFARISFNFCVLCLAEQSRAAF